MKTSLTSFDLRALVAEWQGLVGGHVDKIYQREDEAILRTNLPATGKVGPEDGFVFPLIDLVDVPADEPLPLRDKSAEVEGGQGRFHLAMRRPVRYLIIGPRG